jgi:hypothetical protein
VPAKLLSAAAAGALVLSAPVAWAATSRIAVSPGIAHPGALVTVHGSVDHGCETPGQVTIYSRAFAGATPHEFAGVPAVSATAHTSGTFSRTLRLRPTVRAGSYSIGGRCGGANFGAAALRVTPKVPAGVMAVGADARLRRASALWSAQHLRNYSFRITVTCFCSAETRRPHVITVRGGKSRGSKYVIKQLQTFSGMFALIRHGLADPLAGPTTVTYDQRRGFPRSVALDPIRNGIDDEVSWTVDRFRAG